MQGKKEAALTLQTNMRVWLACRRVQRLRKTAVAAHKTALQKTESKRDSQRRLIGPSDYEKRANATAKRVVARRGSGADVFETDMPHQIVESVWPKHWLCCSDAQTGQLYWYNHRTHESRWEAPPDLVGLHKKPQRARQVHEDASWTARENYKARTASVTAGMYGCRQPRYERARMARRLRRATSPQRTASSGVAVGRRRATRPTTAERQQQARAESSAEAGVIDRRSGSSASAWQPPQHQLPVAADPRTRFEENHQLSGHPRRPASARTASGKQSPRLKLNRPHSAPRPGHRSQAELANNLARRAHMSQLCQPKAIAAVMRLHTEAPPQLKSAYEARPPSVASSITMPCEPIMPVVSSHEAGHNVNSGRGRPQRRPQSARPALQQNPRPPSAGTTHRQRNRPSSATTALPLKSSSSSTAVAAPPIGVALARGGRSSGQGPLGRSYRAFPGQGSHPPAQPYLRSPRSDVVSLLATVLPTSSVF